MTDYRPRQDIHYCGSPTHELSNLYDFLVPVVYVFDDYEGRPIEQEIFICFRCLAKQLTPFSRRTKKDCDL